MALYSVQIMQPESNSSIKLWQEKNNPAAILNWAREKASELFGDVDCRVIIEEDKPAA